MGAPTIIGRPIAAMALVAAMAAPALAEMRIPDCDGITAWAAKANAVDGAAMQSGSHQQFRSGAWLLSGFKDEHWLAAFGASFAETTPAAYARLLDAAETCRQEGRAQMRQLPRNSPQRNVLIAADQYLLAAFRGRRPTPQAVAPELQLHKAAYARHAEAGAVRDAQLRELESLEPALESIAAVEAMKKEAKLAGLGPEREAHVKRLEAAVLDLADAIVTKAAEEMAALPESLAGLRALNDFREKTRAEIGSLQSRKWQAFKDADAERLKTLGEAALPEFVAELQAAPASAEGKAKVEGAVAALFPQQPMPRNVRDYRRAAAQRLGEIEAEIKAIACNETLARHGLADDAKAPLLGPDGKSSLGSFVCGLEESGHAFAAYKKPGWFGSTHELTLQAPSGTSLVVEMKALEAVKGRPKMLVGTRLKDAVRTEDLTLGSWQALAAELTAYKAGGPAVETLLPAAQAELDRDPAGCVRTVDMQSITSFPVVLQAGGLDRDTVRQFALLEALGLVSVEQAPSQNPSYRTYRYTLTEKAQPYFKGKNGLCFAELVAEDISDISEPFERGGRTYVTGVLAIAPSLPEFALDPRFVQAVAGPQQGDLRRLVTAAQSGEAMQVEVPFVQTADGWQPAK